MESYSTMSSVDNCVQLTIHLSPGNVKCHNKNLFDSLQNILIFLNDHSKLRVCESFVCNGEKNHSFTLLRRKRM